MASYLSECAFKIRIKPIFGTLAILAYVSAKVTRLSHPHVYQKEDPDGYIDEKDFKDSGYPAPKTCAPKENIWASITNDEAASVIKWLHKHSGLNLTSAENATAWDNKISVVDLLAPNKVRLSIENC